MAEISAKWNLVMNVKSMAVHGEVGWGDEDGAVILERYVIQAHGAAVGCIQGSKCQTKSFSLLHPIASGSRRLLSMEGELRLSQRGKTSDASPLSKKVNYHSVPA